MYYFPNIKQINNIRSQLIEVAQDEYDKWEQDENGFDEEYGSGGICHLIADRMIDIIHQNLTTENKEVFAVSKSLSDVQHVNILMSLDDGVYEIDIPYSIYETGGGFNWKKVPDVIFEVNDIQIELLDINLKNAYLYLEDNEEISYEGEDSEETNEYIESVNIHLKKQEEKHFSPSL